MIPGDDLAVHLQSFQSITPHDYLKYLVAAMQPRSSTIKTTNVQDLYNLIIHDDTSGKFGGPYFEIKQVRKRLTQYDAYSIDVGYPTANIVTQLRVENNENYSLYYDYNKKLNPEEYVRRLNDQGEWEDVYAPSFTSRNELFETRAEDISWYTKLTKFPVSATITIQGLLRPATLMTYVRINVIFPGGHKHITSGLYIVTKQVDTIDGNGYRTQLGLTKISGDNYLDIQNTYGN